MVDYPDEETGDIHNKEIQREVSVAEAMNKTVITMDINADVPAIAREMANSNAGSVIITENGKAIGIITERDLVKSVVVKNRKPDEVKVSKILSSPLITIEPDKSVIEASELMLKANIKRLPVMKNGVIMGVISNTDILMIAPGLNAILKNLIDINRDPLLYIRTNDEMEEEGFRTGMCESCYVFSVDLQLVNGQYLCRFCRQEEGENYE